MNRKNILIIIPLGLLVLGQIIGKFASNGVDINAIHIRQYMHFLPIFGIILLFMRGIIWIFILKNIKLTFAYPMMSSSYVIIIFLSWIFFDEAITMKKMLAAICIIIGCTFIAMANMEIKRT